MSLYSWNWYRSGVFCGSIALLTFRMVCRLAISPAHIGATGVGVFGPS